MGGWLLVLYAGPATAARADHAQLKGWPLWLAAYPYGTAQQGFGAQAALDWAKGLGGGLTGWDIMAWQYTGTGRLEGWAGDLDMSELYQPLTSFYKGGSTASTAKTVTTGLTWPVGESSTISQHFGENATSFSVDTGGHTGTDFAVAAGTSVKAVADGTVLWADWSNALPSASWAARWYFDQANGGIIVLLDHGTYTSAYCHLSKTDLNPGDVVKQGQEIALSGNTGAATTGPHLHFEIMPKPLDYSTASSPLKIYGRVDGVAWLKSHTTTKLAAAGGSQQTGDWFDMATEADLERAVENVLKKAIKREGAGQSGTTSIWAMAAWMDANLTDLRRRQTNVARMVRDLWATYRLGIQSVQTDGFLGAGVRKVFGYSESALGDKRKADYKQAAGKDFSA